MSTVFDYMPCDINSPVNAVKLGVNRIPMSFFKQTAYRKTATGSSWLYIKYGN